MTDNSELIERLCEEQARLQRILDTKDVNVARKRTLSFRLKMVRQAAQALRDAGAYKANDEIRAIENKRLRDEVESLQARIAELECEAHSMGAATTLKMIKNRDKRIAELEGRGIHRGIYHHPDCNYWQWDWRYSWAESDCNCEDVCGPSEQALKPCTT